MNSSAPMKNQIESIPGRCIAFYQKITCKIRNAAPTTAAQKTGRLYRGRCPSEGTSVQPYTKPTNSEVGLGRVARLTSTVTTAQMTPDHSARNMFSAMSLASEDSAI